MRDLTWLDKAPKTHLHIHLEGATTAQTYLELAEKNKITLPFQTVEDGNRYFEFVNLIHFLDVYHTCTTAVRTPDDFHVMIERLAKSEVEQNVRYCEFFISLSLHILHEMDPIPLLSAINIACRDMESKYDIKLRCIPDISRDRDIGIALDALKAVIRSKSEYIIGFGLAGSERNDSKKFAGIMQTAAQSGLRVVAHAGEWRDSQVIWDAINYINAERIGHGITCVKDKQLMDFLAATQLPIEVCPTSNYRTQLVKAGEPHPIHEMIKHGLNVTVNADDPTMFNTSLNREFRKLGEYGLTDPQLVQLLKRNINASFMSMADKKIQFNRLQGFLTEHNIKSEENI